MAAVAPLRARLRVADVTLLYGERSGGIRTYLQAKAAWARGTGAIEQHLVVPGRRRRSTGNRHELPSIRYEAANGYRLPLGGAELLETLDAIAPDVVLLHDPFWTPRQIARAARGAHRLVVAVHHTSVALNANGLPGATGLWERPLRRWYRHAYRDVDAVMSVVDPYDDTGRRPSMPLRLGLDPAFRPRADAVRGEHVLFAGRLAREKGVGELLEATAAGDWPLVVHGSGPWEQALHTRVRALGLADRVRFAPYVCGRGALARAFARASCVAVPGPFETFGLVALEAAAAGAPVVVADSAPSGRLLGTLGHPFRAGDAADLARAIEAARRAPRQFEEAAALGRRHGWDAAFAAELADLERLVDEHTALEPTAWRAA